MSLKHRGPASVRALLVLPCAVALLAACGMLDTEREITKPPPTLVSGKGEVVTIDDDRSGSPVELRTDQKLAVRLRLAGSSHSDWTLVDFKPGVLARVGGARFEQDNTAAQYGEIAGTQSWRFEPTQPGETTLRFELRVPHSREPATAVATFAVTVR